MEPLRSISREGGGEEGQGGREDDKRAARARPANRGVSTYLWKGREERRRSRDREKK